ncbi:MAG: tyrosine-type recombinase/integrase [Oscillospiraceae bacterium]|nr:tyrosine-type recombinase/integrase [Oscillospiraceae bacterium]
MYNYNKNEIPQFLREFLDYFSTIKGRSQNTVISYFHDLKSFLRFLKVKHNLAPKDVDFEEIEVDDFPAELIKGVVLYDVLEFLHYLAGERSNTLKARARRAVAIRQFFKYLTNNKQWFEVSPAQNLEMPGAKPPLPKSLTLEQAMQLLSTCDYDSENWMAVRDYCIMTFFLNCGMRLNELVGLNLQDYKKELCAITGEPLYYIRVTGKGNKERIVYLNSACALSHEKYIDKRNQLCDENERARHEKALFLSKRYTRITGRRVEQIIAEKLRVCGLDGLGFSVHKLRHTAATLMYRNGVDIRVLKEVLGHENLGTTQIYTHVANEQMRQAINNNPLSDVNKTDKNGQ